MSTEINLYHGDCIPGMRDNVSDESCDLLVTSIPFGALFSYSHKAEDIGNNLDGDACMHGSQFGLHMRFWVDNVFRIMKPGSLVCIHIQQLLRTKVQHGYMGMRDFRGSVITLMENHGFQTHGEVAIIKNPQNVAQRLSLHSLMFVTAYRDASMLAPAMNDYVVIFKKPGEREKKINACIESQRDIWLVEPSPIIDYIKFGSAKDVIKKVKPNYKEIPYRIYEYTADGRKIEKETIGGTGINPNGWFTKNDWVAYAHGAWFDILQIDVLDGFRGCKENDEEKHVCPLQLEVIRRFIKLYSNPGDTVIDPFMGIGSTAWVAIEQERNVIGFELKDSYYEMSLRNIKKAKQNKPQMTFEDILED